MGSERESQAAIMRMRRQLERDITPCSVANPRRRKLCEHDDPRFLRTYLPGVFYCPFTSEQEQFIEDCGRALKYGTRKAKAMPRGGGKSSIVKYLQLKYALYRQLRFPLIVAATSHKATQTLKDIKTKLRSPVNKELHEDFPFDTSIARYVASAPSRANNVTWGGLPVHIEWGPDRIIMPSLPDGHGGFAIVKHGLPPHPEQIGTILACLGFTSDDLQGCNVQDVRPDFVMLDDLDSRDSLSAENGIVADKIEECIDKTVAGLGGPNRRLGRVYICTITSRRSAAYRYTDLKNKPAWGGQRVARIISWPKRKDLWDKYVTLRTENLASDKYGRKARDLLVANFDEMHLGAIVSTPHDYNQEPLEDGEPEHLSPLQKCYDYIADEGMDSFLTEHQNDPPEVDVFSQSRLTWLSVAESAGEFLQRQVDPTTTAIVRGVDVRKIELHDVTLATDSLVRYRVADYGVRSHGTNETTVEQAETLILEALYRLSDKWNTQPLKDEHGVAYSADLTLIDKGWIGNWNEEGEIKTWVSQPVETFCLEAGLDRFLPAKGAPNYSPQAPAPGVIIGDNWHINRGRGKNRICDEVIWNAAHWHRLVEELFLLSEDNQDRAELFAVEGGTWSNHRVFAQHIESGSRQLHAEMARGSRSRKPQFRRDHWWDAMAMALVGMSIIGHRVKRRERQKPRMTLSQMAGR